MILIDFGRWFFFFQIPCVCISIMAFLVFEVLYGFAHVSPLYAISLCFLAFKLGDILDC